ncbi:hypothetical protein [Mucisphaera calidilacus]|uniref:Secreted protein n=1 Tax=Mucisphaera calidilacus TaxID=2527982 RepID=A0A518BTJ3_9BACT|nr:hypothetical protein [Mucisphaera calidilacus]QDU70287.1 hypothetical protein Pan265_01100 [Mucisphaera calidilacus]
MKHWILLVTFISGTLLHGAALVCHASPAVGPAESTCCCILACPCDDDCSADATPPLPPVDETDPILLPSRGETPDLTQPVLRIVTLTHPLSRSFQDAAARATCRTSRPLLCVWRH